MHVRSWSRRGFTIVEALLGFVVLSVGLLAFYATLSRSLILSETNKQVKIALNDAQTIIEEIAGIPFDAIMDPDYPTAEVPAPRFRHRQEIAPTRLFGSNPDTGLSNPPRLEDQRVTVTYAALDTSDADGDGIFDEVLLDTADVNGDGDTNEWRPLPIVPGSATKTNLAPTGASSVEQFRPANNSPALDEFRTPEPLYITVSVSWIGPVRVLDSVGNPVRMTQKLTFIRCR
jgi:hypothetical protein